MIKSSRNMKNSKMKTMSEKFLKLQRNNDQMLSSDVEHGEREFDPNEKGFNAKKELSLPETVWITPLILINTWRHGYEGVSTYCTIFFFATGQFLLFLTNMALQFGLVYAVQHIAIQNSSTKDGSKIDCSTVDTNNKLVLVALIIFLMFNMTNLVECFHLTSYILHTPTNKDCANFTIIEDKNGKTRTGVGMTIIQKTLAILMMPIPYFIVSIYLAMYGSKYLLESQENSDLILNMVALTFIQDIDAIMWIGLVPESFKKIRDAYPIIESSTTNLLILSLSCKSISYLGTIGTASYFIMHHYCD